MSEFALSCLVPHLQPNFSMTISSAVFGVSCCEWLDENLAEFFDVTVFDL